MCVQLAEGSPDEPDDDERTRRRDKKIGRYGEHPASLADAAQVAVTHERDDDARDDKRDLAVRQRRERRCQPVGTSGYLNGDGDDVVDDQGDGRDLGHLHPEVLPRHDIRAAGAGIDHDDFAVGKRHEQQHDDDGQCQRQKETEGRHSDRPHEHEEDLLAPISGRRDAVRGENPERHRLAEALD